MFKKDWIDEELNTFIQFVNKSIFLITIHLEIYIFNNDVFHICNITSNKK